MGSWEPQQLSWVTGIHPRQYLGDDGGGGGSVGGGGCGDGCGGSSCGCGRYPGSLIGGCLGTLADVGLTGETQANNFITSLGECDHHFHSANQPNKLPKWGEEKIISISPVGGQTSPGII